MALQALHAIVRVRNLILTERQGVDVEKRSLILSGSNLGSQRWELVSISKALVKFSAESIEFSVCLRPISLKVIINLQERVQI